MIYYSIVHGEGWIGLMTNSVILQTIAQIRTVLAYVGESRALQSYSAALRVAQRLGYKIGLAKGLGLGATYFTVFCCYALLLWYGGYLVRHHYTNGGLAIATMFAVMIGGLYVLYSYLHSLFFFNIILFWT